MRLIVFWYKFGFALGATMRTLAVIYVIADAGFRIYNHESIVINVIALTFFNAISALGKFAQDFSFGLQYLIAMHSPQPNIPQFTMEDEDELDKLINKFREDNWHKE